MSKLMIIDLTAENSFWHILDSKSHNGSVAGANLDRMHQLITVKLFIEDQKIITLLLEHHIFFQQLC